MKVIIQDNGREREVTDYVLAGGRVEDVDGIYLEARFDPITAAVELFQKVDHDAISYDAAIVLVADLIEKGHSVPEPLRKWTAAVLRLEVGRPKLNGKIKGATRARDKLIVGLIDEVILLLGLDPSASERSGGQSACHAVAEAFRLLGVHPNSYESMIKIWQSRENLRGFDSRDD